MSTMFELYYRPPTDSAREAALTEQIVGLGGRLDYREVPCEGSDGGVCLTYEFADWNCAEAVAAVMRRQGEHIEGPYEYGD
jgi:hypothetical protein